MNMGLMDKLRQKYKGKKILVVGLGLQMGGVGLAKFFNELGAKVTVTDKKTKEQLRTSIELLKDYPIELHLGGHNIDDFMNTDYIFKGPSVLWDSPEISAALKKGILVEMEMSFVAKHYPGKIIGITGTRGKSTTTNLIFNLLKLSGFPVILGGGLPGISTIEYLKTATPNDYLVAELSSWALSGFHREKVSPHIAVLTNIYPDHLNYYKNIEDYIYDKQAVFAYQKKGDYCILNSNIFNQIEKVRDHFFDRLTPMGPQAIVSKKVSSLFQNKKITLTSSQKILFFSSGDFTSSLKYLRGGHNLENAAAALQIAKILGMDEKKAANIIANFKGLPFRQEIVGEKNNIIFVNDTTSTTPVATEKAIESFSDHDIYLILGGNSKNLPYEKLIGKLSKVKKIILLAGSFTDQILVTLRVTSLDKLSKDIFNDLGKAVEEAYRQASNQKEKAYILFSPGATSFAMFNNEFHRGREFNRVVKKITNVK